MLVVARFVQGLGGAMTSAVILGMIVTMFTEPRERARAIGTYSFVASAGGAVGLLAGGVLTQTLDWHWIFFLNLPIGIATGLLAMRLLERDQGIGIEHGADLPGAALITSSLMLGVYTIVEPAARQGWTSTRTLGLGAASLLLLAGFVLREARAANPLVPLQIFRARNVSGANAVAALAVAGMFGMFFMGALYMQRVLGYDALQTGFAFLPVTIVMCIVSLRYAERLITRFGAKSTLVPGLVLSAAGLGLFTQAPLDGDYATTVLPVMLLLGLGGGLTFPALMTLAMSGATASDAGLASGLVNTMLQVGGALGLAVLATLAATRTEALAAGGAGPEEALLGGYHLAFVVAACLVGAAVAVAVLVLEQPAREPVAEHAPACQPAGD
jgi:MFS family permease